MFMISPGPLGRDSGVLLYPTFWRYPDPDCQPHQILGPEEPFEARALASWDLPGLGESQGPRLGDLHQGRAVSLPQFPLLACGALWFKPELAMTQQHWLQDVDHLACVGWPSFPIWRTVVLLSGPRVVLPSGHRVVLLSFFLLFRLTMGAWCLCASVSPFVIQLAQILF